MTTTTEWRTHTGAEYDDIRQVPCMSIANGYLIDAAGDPIPENHLEVATEIQRRGDIYRDHGYGEGHEVPGWGGIPVIGCDHAPNEI